MTRKKSRNDARKRRHLAVRKRISGTSDIPRISVFRSAKHIYAQIVDDVSQTTLLNASTVCAKTRERLSAGGLKKSEVAREVGRHLGEMAVERGIRKVRFDRGGYAYHGRVKSLADGMREAGLEF